MAFVEYDPATETPEQALERVRNADSAGRIYDSTLEFFARARATTAQSSDSDNFEELELSVRAYNVLLDLARECGLSGSLTVKQEISPRWKTGTQYVLVVSPLSSEDDFQMI